MSRYVILDGGGLVTGFGSLGPGQALPGGALYVVVPPVVFSPEPDEIGLADPDARNSLGQMMQQGAYLVARPVSPAPIVSAGEITLAPVPAGTVIEVYDLSGGERMTQIVAPADDYVETFAFTDPGQYRVEVEAPAPALPSVAELEVT